MNTVMRQDSGIFLEQHQEIQEFDLLLADMNGVFRGKRIQRQKLEAVWEEGIYLPASIFAMDVTGETMEETGLGFASGDR